MGDALRVEHPAVIESLPRLLAFVDDACGRHHVGREDAFAIRLATEEVCMNLIRHGYAGRPPGPIEIEFARAADRATVTIRDRAAAFEPNSAPPPDLVSDSERRRVGGLGWHLVKHMVDEIAYRSDPERGNQLTLVKLLKERTA